MKIYRIFLLSIFVLLSLSRSGFTSEIVINEVMYNPSERYTYDYEYVEIYNSSDKAADLGGYSFTEGIFYRIPDGTVLDANAYLLLVRNPDLAHWRNQRATVLGPYIDVLDHKGELLLLRGPDGTVIDEADYDDFTPWPRGADGYGKSMERIGADLPGADPYSWRASLSDGGSPGRENSVVNIPARPVVVDWTATPSHPRSSDEVQIEAVMEGDAGDIRRVDLQYEVWDTIGRGGKQQVRTERIDSEDGLLHYIATVPAQESQSLVRFNWAVSLQNQQSVLLPHEGEPRPFESYFVYDGEMQSRFPILWMFPDLSSNLPGTSRDVRGVAIKPVDSDVVQVYDGCRIENSLVDNTGRKIKFLKQEEYRGDRTINLSPERPTHPNSGGADTNHKEHLGFQVFRDRGVLAPRCDWMRVIELGVFEQRTATEQVNEKFLEINELDPTSDIYKIAYNEPNYLPGVSSNYSKQNNPETGADDLIQLIADIHWGTDEEIEWAIRRYLEIDKVIEYSVAGVFIGNWDGFFNNMFLIHTPFPIDKWECVPWDLDKIFGYTDGAPPYSTTFAEMPLEFPLDGRAALASRQPGPISRPVHSIYEFNETYLDKMREALNGSFSLESMNERIDEIEAILLDDLQMEAEYTGVYRTRRETQIKSAYDTVRTFLELRHAYLRPLLFTPVMEWAVY